MVRPVLKSNNNCSTEMEIKTLKLSNDMKSNLRSPMIWEKPPSSMYKYHYEICGLYYQPMIKYCIAREGGMKRTEVDMPDRMQSNYDKRSYKLKNIRPDYEQFLVQLYQKRIKSNSTKFSHCANEMARFSKNSSELGIVKDSASMRDKYLAQLQLMYTENLAKQGCVKGGIVEKGKGEEVTLWEEEQLDPATEKKTANKMLSCHKDDRRYYPSFERITVLDSERYKRGEEVDFLRGCYNPKMKKADTSCTDDIKESVKIVRTVDGVVVENSSDVSERKSYVNPGHLEADTMLQFLNVTKQENLAAAPASERDIPPMYRDTTLSRAAEDVKLRVKEAGNKLLPKKPALKEMNFNYREKEIEKIGKFERAYVRSTMYKKPALPDFDVGYDCV